MRSKAASVSADVRNISMGLFPPSPATGVFIQTLALILFPSNKSSAALYKAAQRYNLSLSASVKNPDLYLLLSEAGEMAVILASCFFFHSRNIS